MTKPRKYVALGDSVSIAYYPERDALTRLKRKITGLGAPDLLVSNNDELWPEFNGRDLSSIFGPIGYQNLAVDGGTMETVLAYQLPRLEGSAADLITLTVGGNDLLDMLLVAKSAAVITQRVAQLGARYRDIVSRVRAAVPEALLLVTTVYDPTDETGKLPDWGSDIPISLLTPLNDTIREVASSDSRTLLSDVHHHFLGHGVSAPANERWYLSESIIEPSLDGASEVRRVWLDSLRAAEAFG